MGLTKYHEYFRDVTWGEGFCLKSPAYFYSDYFLKQNRWTLFTEFKSFEDFKKRIKKEVDKIRLNTKKLKNTIISYSARL